MRGDRDLSHPMPRVLRAALAVALACTWLVMGAMPADAAIDWGVQSPGPGERVTGSFTLTAFVDTFRDNRAEAVRARFRKGEQPVGAVRNLQRQSESEQGPGVVRSTWATSMSPESLANGMYTVEVSVVNAVHRDGSPWRGHEIAIDAPPVAKLETVRVADAQARKVEVRWVRSGAPDMRRYVVQRAKAGGNFTDVHTAGAGDSTVHTDVVPEDGEYRYRVKAVRAGADGGDREAVSEPRSVTVTPTASGRPENNDGDNSGPLAPRPSDGSDGSEDPGEAGEGAQRRSGGASAPRLSPRNRNGGGNEARQGQASAPDVAGPNPNSQFRQELDYGVELPEFEREVTERVAAADDAVRDGGTLTVYDRDLQTDQFLVPVATGLVFVLGGLHIRRFLQPA